MKKLKLLLFLSIILVLVSGATLAQSLKIYCIDVNQGDSTLIVTPNKKSILIDCGASEAFMNKDCGPKNVADAVFNIIKNEAELESIDYFICTHYHDDHIGALKKLFDKLEEENISIKNYYDRGYNKLTSGNNISNVQYYTDYISIIGENRKKLVPGQKIDIDENVTVECIVGCGITKGEEERNRFPRDENPSSLGLIISYNDFEFLIAGDLTTKVEFELVEKGIYKDVDVYQANHHGSNGSSNICFLLAFRPEVCIISNGSYEGYNHPPEKKINELRQVFPKMTIYQTNKNTYEDEEQYQNKIENVDDIYIGDLDCNGFEGTILIEVLANTYIVKILDRNIGRAYNIEK